MALRYNTNLSLIMFDIDFFKAINDKYGHKIGDEVLITLTQGVSNRIRNGDIFARIGGEEFVVLMRNTSLQSAILLATQLKEMIQSLQVDANELSVTFTASFGVSELSQTDKNFETLLSRADKLMYQAKGEGRNRIAY